MQTQSLPKKFIAAVAIFFSAATIHAQTINVVPEPGPQYDYITTGAHGGSSWGYSGDPIVYNNQLYVQYQRVAYDLAQNGAVPLQLAQYSGNTLNLIANPDTLINGTANGYVGNPIVFNNKLYINYENAASVNQLAAYNGGTTLQLIPNPDASPYGYEGAPIIYNNALYIGYDNAAGVSQLAKFDGTTITLIPNPDASPYGYRGNPIIYNGKLFVKYSINSAPGYPWALASYDGTSWTIYPNPDASTYGYQGNQIIYNGKLYGRYASSITGKSQLMVYDGTANPTLISNPDAGNGYNGFPIVYNNNLFIQYQNTSNVLQLATYNGTSITLIPNPDASTTAYQGTPIVYNNTLCIFYNSIAKVNRLAVYNGGDTLHLVPNPDTSANGYWNFPIVYGANLYYQYNNAAGVFQLGYFNGTAMSLIPNPTGAFGGAASYEGNPLVFNNLLYTQFNQVQWNSFSNLAYFDGSTLPVTYLNFDGKLQNDEAFLTWNTTNEINNKGFEVQKSMDGQIFTDIGFIAGHGNSSSVNNYNYTDPKVLSGSNYYRLKQIDNDGNFNYSSVIKLDYSKFDWEVLGNPIANNSWVQIQLDKASNVSLQIVSINGNLIQTINKGNLSAGTYSIPLNLGSASAGIYVVRLVVDDKSYSKKVMK